MSASAAARAALTASASPDVGSPGAFTCVVTSTRSRPRPTRAHRCDAGKIARDRVQDQEGPTRLLRRDDGRQLGDDALAEADVDGQSASKRADARHRRPRRHDPFPPPSASSARASPSLAALRTRTATISPAESRPIWRPSISSHSSARSPKPSSCRCRGPMLLNQNGSASNDGAAPTHAVGRLDPRPPRPVPVGELDLPVAWVCHRCAVAAGPQPVVTLDAHRVVDAERPPAVAPQLAGQRRGDPGRDDDDLRLEVTVRARAHEPPARAFVAHGLLHLAASEKADAEVIEDPGGEARDGIVELVQGPFLELQQRDLVLGRERRGRLDADQPGSDDEHAPRGAESAAEPAEGRPGRVRIRALEPRNGRACVFEAGRPDERALRRVPRELAAALVDAEPTRSRSSARTTPSM